MLKEALRKGITLSYLAIFVTAAILGAYKSAQKSLEAFTATEIKSVSNIARHLPRTESSAILRSRQSAVQVMSLDMTDGGISSSSGTYLTFDQKYFVLTTAHGVGGHCIFTQIVVNDNLYDCTGYVLQDSQTDYIVIQVDRIPELVPVRIPADIPHRKEWIPELATQNTIFYTGFPNQGGPYTFDGRIVGYEESEALFVDSYGWSGSSGAGVFSRNGKLIGWIRALEIGDTYFGTQVLENFIWVIPLFKVDWPAIKALAD